MSTRNVEAQRRLKAMKLADGFQIVKDFFDGVYSAELSNLEKELRTDKDIVAATPAALMELRLEQMEQICERDTVRAPKLLASRIAEVLEFEYKPTLQSPMDTPVAVPASADGGPRGEMPRSADGTGMLYSAASAGAVQRPEREKFPPGTFARNGEKPSMGAMMTNEQIAEQRRLFYATDFTRYGLPQPTFDVRGEVVSKGTLRPGKEYIVCDLTTETGVLVFEDGHPDGIWYEMMARFATDCFTLPPRKGRVIDGEDAQFEYWKESMKGHFENGRSKVRSGHSPGRRLPRTRQHKRTHPAPHSPRNTRQNVMLVVTLSAGAGLPEALQAC